MMLPSRGLEERPEQMTQGERRLRLWNTPWRLGVVVWMSVSEWERVYGRWRAPDRASLCCLPVHSANRSPSQFCVFPRSMASASNHKGRKAELLRDLRTRDVGGGSTELQVVISWSSCSDMYTRCLFHASTRITVASLCY